MAYVRPRLDVEGRLVRGVAVEEGPVRVHVNSDSGQLRVFVRDMSVDSRRQWSLREEPTATEKGENHNLQHKSGKLWTYINASTISMGRSTGSPDIFAKAMLDTERMGQICWPFSLPCRFSCCRQQLLACFPSLSMQSGKEVAFSRLN